MSENSENIITWAEIRRRATSYVRPPESAPEVERLDCSDGTCGAADCGRCRPEWATRTEIEAGVGGGL